MDEDLKDFYLWAKGLRLTLDIVINKIERRQPLTAQEIDDVEGLFIMHEKGIPLFDTK